MGLLTNDPGGVKFLFEVFAFIGAFQIGVAILTIAASIIGYRKEERRIWLAFLYYPVLFGANAHAEMAAGDVPLPTFPLFVLSIVALLLPHR